MRIGVMGGTFDPIHCGHLLMAENAREEAKLDKVLFVPNGHPPHKRGVVGTPEQRWHMCELALRGYEDYFELSDCEMAQRDFFYTAHTLEDLRGKHPGDTLCLIVGADEALHFTAWHQYERILKIAELVIVQRPPFVVTATQLEVDLPSAKYTIVQDISFNISSTMMRDRLHTGRTVRFMVPDVVANYIAINEIYR